MSPTTSTAVATPRFPHRPRRTRRVIAVGVAFVVAFVVAGTGINLAVSLDVSRQLDALELAALRLRAASATLVESNERTASTHGKALACIGPAVEPAGADVGADPDHARLAPWSLLPPVPPIRLTRLDVDRLLASAREPGCRIVPAFESGRAIGFKIFGAKPGSAAAELGFANGDVLVALNNQPLSRIDRGLELYSSLPTITDLQASVLRRGYAVRIDYRID